MLWSKTKKLSPCRPFSGSIDPSIHFKTTIDAIDVILKLAKTMRVVFRWRDCIFMTFLATLERSREDLLCEKSRHLVIEKRRNPCNVAWILWILKCIIEIRKYFVVLKGSKKERCKRSSILFTEIFSSGDVTQHFFHLETALEIPRRTFLCKTRKLILFEV